MALLRRLRTQQEATRRRKSAAVLRKLARLAVFRKARTVLCYVSLPYEVETTQLIRRMLRAGKRVVVPIVQGTRLRVSELRKLSDLAPGAYGVLEPRADARRPVALSALDLAVVPGVAFDRSGHRLGHGQGYFDRLLARLSPAVPRVGLGFDFQLLDRLPTDPHDQPVDTVLTA